MEENENNELENNEIESFEEKHEAEVKYLKRQWAYKSVVWLVVLGCIIGVASASLTYYITLKRQEKKFVTSTLQIESEKTNAIDSLDDLEGVLASFAEIVDSEYIGDIDKKELVDETVKGFIKGLGDDYSEFMTKEEWEDYQETALGNYSGVGIVMTANSNGYILVNGVIKDSPAEKAGIKQGDYIVGVNGESIYGEEMTEVAKLVKGDPGTEVTLNVSNGTDVTDYKIVRENIRIYHVESQMLEDGVGYIVFNTFDEGCAKEFEEETDKLVEQGAKKLILDLRYNTGGAVDQALQILDLFLEKGQIELITESANGLKITTSSQTDKKYNFENIVILINKYTASASEIMTGCLIDNELAKTVGEKSYGKGVMQSVFGLSDGSVLKLTTQEYNTPNGTKINGVGITPDYEVEDTRENTNDTDVQLEKAKSVLKGEE